MQIVVGKCKIAHSFLKNKIINKSDWCWQRWLCDWVTQLVRLQCFQGVLVTGVRFRLNKFPPSNMQALCFHTPHNHGIFFHRWSNWTCWKALDRWWEALAGAGIFPSWLTKNTKVAEIVGKLKIFFGYHASLISANHQQSR